MDPIIADLPPVSRPAPRPPAKRRIIRHALVFVLIMVTIGAALMLPGLMQARIATNETAAIETLRMLSTRQAQFQSAAVVDQDGDGVGEYGFLSELGGAVVPRGRAEMQAFRSREVSLSDLAQSVAENDGLAMRSGYYYLAYMRRADGTFVPESAGAVGPSAADANAQEGEFIVYAWPTKLGVTGNRAFVVSQQGEVFATSNRDFQNYDGTRKIPEPHAAFDVTVHPEGDGEVKRMSLVSGQAAADGQTWQAGG